MSDELVLEERNCADCKNFTNHLTGFPTCKKKLMGVVATMRVTYKASEGTCFEEREDPQ